MDPSISPTNAFTTLVKVAGYRTLAPTIAAHRLQRNANANYDAPFWPDAVAVVAALTRDPNLLTSLPVNGSAVSGADGQDVQPAAASGDYGWASRDRGS